MSQLLPSCHGAVVILTAPWFYTPSCSLIGSFFEKRILVPNPEQKKNFKPKKNLQKKFIKKIFC